MKKKILVLSLLLLISLVAYAWAQQNYKLGPEDEIEIRVWDHDDLTRKTRIAMNGMISFPFIGDIKAGGAYGRGIAEGHRTPSGPELYYRPPRQCHRHRL